MHMALTGATQASKTLTPKRSWEEKVMAPKLNLAEDEGSFGTMSDL